MTYLNSANLDELRDAADVIQVASVFWDHGLWLEIQDGFIHKSFTLAKMARELERADCLSLDIVVQSLKYGMWCPLRSFLRF